MVSVCGLSRQFGRASAPMMPQRVQTIRERKAGTGRSPPGGRPKHSSRCSKPYSVRAKRAISGGKVPEERPVYLGNLSEAEFRRHTAEKYGF
jgi:hypothetical protein